MRRPPQLLGIIFCRPHSRRELRNSVPPSTRAVADESLAQLEDYPQFMDKADLFN